jgi:hypothetical protein
MTGPIACGSGFGHRRGEGAGRAASRWSARTTPPPAQWASTVGWRRQLVRCIVFHPRSRRHGVGLPVVDLFKAAGIAPVTVSITGGSSVRQADQSFHVPKRELIRTAVALPPRAAFGVLQVSRIWRTLLRDS